jgi:Baseplate J-like protein
MPLPVPNLDDQTFQNLADLGRALIPGFDPDWTNHNPSDPGITLLELFAWLTESLLYRANRIPDRNQLAFLRLLNGPDWSPGPDLQKDIRSTVLGVRQRYRAVTTEDYEALALEADLRVSRARAVPERYLNAATEQQRQTPKPGYMSVVVVPGSQDPFAPAPQDLLDSVFNYLDPRRLVTTRLSVNSPIYAPVVFQAAVARQKDEPVAALQKTIQGAVMTYLHPLTGGPQGEGWPFGRDIYVSEIFGLLERIPGVDYIPEIRLSSSCAGGPVRCLEAGEIWHDNGDFIGLRLTSYQLPAPAVGTIVIGDAFIPVLVTVSVTPAAGIAIADMNRAAKQAVASLFSPLLSGPKGNVSTDISMAAIRTALLARPEIAALAANGITLEADDAHLIRDQDGNVSGVRIQALELADLDVRLV